MMVLSLEAVKIMSAHQRNCQLVLSVVGSLRNSPGFSEEVAMAVTHPE